MTRGDFEALADLVRRLAERVADLEARTAPVVPVPVEPVPVQLEEPAAGEVTP